MVNQRRQAVAQAQVANNEAIRQVNEYEAQETEALINFLERRLDIELTAEEKNKIRNPAYRYLRYELNKIKNDLSMIMSNFYPGPQGEQISIIPIYQDQVRNLINEWNEAKERQTQAEFNENEGNALLEQYNQYEGGKRKTRKSRKTHRRKTQRRRHAKKSRKHRK